MAAVVSAMLIAAPPALGRTSAQDGYSTPAGSVQQQLGGSGDDRVRGTTVRSTTSSPLPFTGLDVALVLGASGVLLFMGLSIRRLSRPRG